MRTFNYKAQVFYTDGTSSSVQTPLPTITLLEIGEVVMVPSGFQALGLDALDPSKTADYYECWFTNGVNVVITEKRRYYLRDAEHFEVDLWFQNSLGPVEAIALRSGYTRGIDVDKETFVKGTPFSLDSKEHQLFSGDASFTEKYQVSSGYLSKEEVMPYLDIVLSKRVWWKKNGKLIPILIDKGSYQIVEAEEQKGVYAYAINFEFVKAFKQKSFSNINV